MTVTNTKSINEHVSTGSETSWPFTFDVLEASHITAEVVDPNGIASDVTPSISVDLQTKTVNYGPIPNGYIFRIKRNTPITQEVDLESQGPLLPQVIEDGLDKLTHIAQELKNWIETVGVRVGGAKFRGDWKAGETYTIGDVVVYNGSSWIANENHTASSPPPAGGKWILLAAKGDAVDAWTYADLLMLDDGSKPHVLITGREVPGDGGGGLFEWVPGDQSANVAADPLAGIWVAPANDASGTNGAWKRVVNDYVKPEWWGAKSDGRTPSSDAINEAIKFAVSTGTAVSRVVFLSAGEYLLDKPIIFYSTSKIIGSGMHNTRLKKGDFVGYAIDINNFNNLYNSNVWFVTDGAPYGFVLQDFQLYGAKHPPTDTSETVGGIRIYGKGYTLKNVLVFNVDGVGIFSACGTQVGQEWYKDMPESQIDGIFLYKCGSYGMVYEGPHDGNIGNVLVASCGRSGVVFRNTDKSAGVSDITGVIHSYGNEEHGIELLCPMHAYRLIGESNKKSGVVIGGYNTFISQIQTYTNDLENGGNPAVDIIGGSNRVSIDSHFHRSNTEQIVLRSRSLFINVNANYTNYNSSCVFFDIAGNNNKISGVVNGSSTSTVVKSQIAGGGIYSIINLVINGFATAIDNSPNAMRFSVITLSGTTQNTAPTIIASADNTIKMTYTINAGGNAIIS